MLPKWDHVWRDDKQSPVNYSTGANIPSSALNSGRLPGSPWWPHVSFSFVKFLAVRHNRCYYDTRLHHWRRCGWGNPVLIHITLITRHWNMLEFNLCFEIWVSIAYYSLPTLAFSPWDPWTFVFNVTVTGVKDSGQWGPTAATWVRYEGRLDYLIGLCIHG